MHRLDRTSCVFLALAAAWSAVLVVLAVVLHGGATAVLHSGTGAAPSTTTTAGSTLIQENGLKVLIPISVPLVAAAVVAYGLRRRRRRALPGAGPVSWGVTIAAGTACLVGLLTVGPYMVPVAVFLVLACSRAPLQPAPSAEHRPVGTG